MKPLLYIFGKSFKNTLKELKRKPFILILYILILIFVIGMIVITFIMPTQSMNRGTPEAFEAIIMTALFFFFYISLTKGVENGASFFRMSDVNMVFTSPISPKKVLLYGFINQLVISLVFAVFVSFQIPNLKNNFPIKNYGLIIIYLTIIVLIAMLQLSGILIYSIASRNATIRIWFKRGVNIAMVLLLGGFLINLYELKDLFKAGVRYLSSPFFEYIPIIGWFKVVLSASVNGINKEFYLCCGFLIAAFAFLLFVLYKVNTDYYEDVLAATEKKESLLSAKREGKNVSMYANSKLRKISQGYSSKGVKAIFYRQILEHRKTGFLFINKTTLILCVFGIASKFFFPGANIKTSLYFTIYMLFFFGVQGKWAMEVSKPYIYLIPGSSMTKVFYATLSDNLKNVVDGLLLFTAAGIVFGANIFTILLSAIAYTTYGAIFVYTDVVSRRFLGEVHSQVLSIFIKLFVSIFVIVPGLVVSIIIDVTSKGNLLMSYYSLLVIIVYNLLACGIMALLGKSLFETLELK